MRLLCSPNGGNKFNFLIILFYNFLFEVGLFVEIFTKLVVLIFNSDT